MVIPRIKREGSLLISTTFLFFVKIRYVNVFDYLLRHLSNIYLDIVYFMDIFCSEYHRIYLHLLFNAGGQKYGIYDHGNLFALE